MKRRRKNGCTWLIIAVRLYHFSIQILITHLCNGSVKDTGLCLYPDSAEKSLFVWTCFDDVSSVIVRTVVVHIAHYPHFDYFFCFLSFWFWSTTSGLFITNLFITNIDWFEWSLPGMFWKKDASGKLASGFPG